MIEGIREILYMYRKLSKEILEILATLSRSFTARRDGRLIQKYENSKQNN
jgi:hypothetical protein